jgi:hypothetical protein
LKKNLGLCSSQRVGLGKSGEDRGEDKVKQVARRSEETGEEEKLMGYKLIPLENHGRMARGGHGLRKVLSEPVMPDSSIPFRRATHEGRAACGSLLPFWTPTPYAYVENPITTG